jgi:hypothetical protein
MQAQPGQGPWWAALTIWGVVNVVCILQAVGFLSRVLTGSSQVNHLLGYVIVVLAIPTILALVAFVGAHAAWSQWIGPVAFLAFVALMMVVEYIGHIEFRSPRATASWCRISCSSSGRSSSWVFRCSGSTGRCGS